MNPRQMAIGLLERGLASLDWLARRRGRNDMPEHLRTGIAGEDAAFFELRRKGYTVVARRWSSGNLDGDVDLIAWQGPMLCFVEVKTRTARDRTPAEAAVDRTSNMCFAGWPAPMCGTFRRAMRRPRAST